MDAKYVREHLGEALAQACALVAQFQPEDPIEWLADYLRHDVRRDTLAKQRKIDQAERKRILEDAALEDERQRKLKVPFPAPVPLRHPFLWL
jgi:hypothetical protein